MHRTSYKRGVLRSPYSASCIAPVICSVRCTIDAVLRVGLDTASCVATHVYIVVNKLGAFVSGSSATATLTPVA
jgi:hypothetical protein